MEPNPPVDLDSGMPRTSLETGEEVLHHWPVRSGRGVLTSSRIVVLSHPEPLHRHVVWEKELLDIETLDVHEYVAAWEMWAGIHFRFGGGGISSGRLDPEFGVCVDELPVFLGDPAECSAIQAWIDDARLKRSLAEYGQLMPYGSCEVHRAWLKEHGLQQ